MDTTPTRANLAGINDDILRCILDYLPLPGWMWPLLLVCKRLYDSTLPRLYNKMSFALGFDRSHQIAQMLDQRNPGLTYVRELILHTTRSISLEVDFREDPSSSWRFPNHQHHNPCPDAMLLMERLPNDVLRHFSWKSSLLIPAGIVLALWERQRKITEIEIIPCSRDLNVFFVENCDYISKMVNLNSLHIRSTGINQSPIAGKYILQECPAIEILTVDHWRLAYHVTGDGSDECGGLFIPPSPKTKLSLALKTLNLYFMDLRWTSKHIAGAIQIGQLRNLDLHGCNASEFFLDALTSNNEKNLLQLKTFNICHKEASKSGRLVGAIDDLLVSSSNTLTSLSILLRGCYKLPKVIGITAHGSTLKRFFLDVRSKEGPYGKKDYAKVYSFIAWRLLCQSLRKVEQLGAAFPPVVADGCGDMAFMSYIVLACKMPHLRTLNITTIPRTIGSATHAQNPFYFVRFAAHVRLISILATDIFNVRRAWVQESYGSEPRASLDLQVLAFGINDKGRPWERSGRSVRVTYWTPTKVLCTARTFTEMRRTTLLELRKHQQETDILETNFQMYQQRYDNRYWISDEEPSENEDEEDGLGADGDSDEEEEEDDDDNNDSEEYDGDFNDASDDENDFTVDNATEYFDPDPDPEEAAPAVVVSNWPDTTPHPHTHW